MCFGTVVKEFKLLDFHTFLFFFKQDLPATCVSQDKQY